jgi:predicted MPP superfamily phosphohydrolase
VTRHEIVLQNLPAQLDGTTVAAVSDLHLGANIGRGWLAARVEQIQSLAPDLVVMLGDLTEGEAGRLPYVEETLRRLRAPFGVWAVTGNHEFHGDTPATIALFESAGVQWLRDRAVALRPGLRLAGIDYRRGRTRSGSPEAGLLKRLAGPGDGAALLLSHAPLQAKAAADAGFDLMLAGHTHGGQVWPFGYLVRRRYPHFLGRYRVGDMHLLVGRGTGTWGARMRLWHPGEILHITLFSADVISQPSSGA